VRESITPHVTELNLRQPERIVQIPEDLKIVFIQEQFDMIAKTPHKCMEQKRRNRILFEAIPKPADGVLWHFQQSFVRGRRYEVFADIDCGRG
jgi:hypothetical protein